MTMIWYSGTVPNLLLDLLGVKGQTLTSKSQWPFPLILTYPSQDVPSYHGGFLIPCLVNLLALIRLSGVRLDKRRCELWAWITVLSGVEQPDKVCVTVCHSDLDIRARVSGCSSHVHCHARLAISGHRISRMDTLHWALLIKAEILPFHLDPSPQTTVALGQALLGHVNGVEIFCLVGVHI